MCNTRVLCQKNGTVISQCSDCGAFFIWHRNLLLHFQNEEFSSFVKHIKTYCFLERAIPFPDGDCRLVMQSPANEICLVFEEDEWELFKDSLDEALYLGTVYDLLKGKR